MAFQFCSFRFDLVSFSLRCIDSKSIVCRGTFICKEHQRVPFPNRNVIQSQIYFRFYSKLESDRQKFLAAFCIIKFSSTFLIVVCTVLSSKHSKVSLMKFKFLRTDLKDMLRRHFLTWYIYLSSESAQKLTSRWRLQNSLALII